MNKFTVDDPIQNLKDSDNKSWCPIPWITCSTTTNGHYRLCVQANTDRKTRGLYFDAENKPMKASHLPMSKARNSQLVNEVRLAMLEGKQHSACTRCTKDEKNGTLSRRALARFNHDHFYGNVNLKKCVEKTKADGSIDHDDFPLKDLDLRMGNRCNLKCRMCYPGESSKWYEEWHETISKDFHSGIEKVSLKKNHKDKIISEGSSLDWASNSQLIPHLFDDTPELQHMAIVGGEPLLIEEHCKALEKFVETKKASEIIIDYNSNLTILPQRFLNLWKEFKEVKIGYSIDGIGAVNEYIRYPSKWDTIVNNVEKLDRAEGNFDIWPTVTVMAYNVLYVPEILKWQIQSKYKNQNNNFFTLFMVQHPLRNPIELSSQVLPESVKLAVVQKFSDFEKNWFANYLKENVSNEFHEKWTEQLQYLLSSIISHMNEIDMSHHLPEFLKRTQTMDEYRNQKFSTALPELYELLKPHINK